MPSYAVSRTPTDHLKIPRYSPSATRGSSGAAGTGLAMVKSDTVELIACPPKHAQLMESRCVDNYRRANTGRAPEPDSHLWLCLRCPHGAARAGVEVRQGVITEACLQCGQPSRRLIWGRHCVSCYNRRREFRVGINARGRYPSHLPPTIEYRLSVAVDGKPPTARAIEAVTAPEAILAAALSGPVAVSRAPFDIEALAPDRTAR